MADEKPKLRLGALVSLVAGSMIGAGIFSLPQNMAASASAGVVLVGWLITAAGMLMLAFVFQTLSNRRPDLDAGIYAYAKAGFGDYMGFSSAWGYWISAWLGNVSYLVLVFSTLGYYFPMFGEGNTVAAVVCASILLWLLHFLVLRGIQQAAFINTVATIAKVVPILLFIVIVAFAFKPSVFFDDFWGTGNTDLGSFMTQLRGMMLVTVWVFIGIEGASIYSARAQNRSDVGKATVIGFLGVLLLLVAVSVLSMGVLSQPELANLQDPSMAGVLEHLVGHVGFTCDQYRPAHFARRGAAGLDTVVRRDSVRRGQRPHHAGLSQAREREPCAQQCAVVVERFHPAVSGHHAVQRIDLPEPVVSGHVDDSGAVPVVGRLRIADELAR
ncbi:Arginine-ornithine antiporter protein [Salinisphaera shabanensis E1L3A]|uniref:Arginine-ornithine antiporter protein n=1 Tax=Salinisphaera shabanensis E1L3A TaxID=1033802 RepID=A0ACB4V5T6_9GAMM|nr:Arginine-ornithine antiporter protein [Salinisphaera shabanensis E1L3A]